MSLWPFRTGNDDRYVTTSAGQEESIYDALHGKLPQHRYTVEVANYLEWRWRRGIMQSVFPVTCCSALIGFLVGFRQSRVEGRYIGRYRIMWRYTSTFAAVGLLTTAFHHFLVVKNHYHDTFYYPILAGTAGSVVLTVAAQMGSVGQGMFVGSLIGVLYALSCYGVNYYHRRRLNNFLYQQQLQQVPIHKITPELQPAYRAYLFDNRPLEESDRARREAILLSRASDDTRLDAQTFMHNMTPEVYDWVNFPDWWPLKWPVQTEDEQLIVERQREEEVERRKKVFLETEDGGLLKRKNRAKPYRDLFRSMVPHNQTAVPKTFRAIMQRLGIAKLRNSPVRRVESAAARKLQEKETGAEASDEHLSPLFSATKNAKEGDVSEGFSNAAEAFIARLQTPAAITDHLRQKGQEAMHVATLRAAAMLESARESAMQRSAQVVAASQRSGGGEQTDSPTVLHKFQQTVRDSRRDYYSRVPFDERWDGIMSSIAVLGRTSIGNTVTPYRDSGDAFLDMWKAVDAGQHEVLWQTYICKDDAVGQKTVHKLAEARMKRGCTTELLYDCGGNISGRSRLTEELKQCGATVIQYRPFFHSTLEYVFKGFDWRISPGLRNHRKILLVDGKIGFCGGLNIGNEYCGPQAGGSGKFRDTHCAVVGPAVAHLREVYEDTKEPRPWKYSWARWRQIATTQINRKYESGKHVVEENVLRKLQNTTKAVTLRGGVYFRDQFRKAENNTQRVLERMRWVKQAQQKAQCEQWYDRQSAAAEAKEADPAKPLRATEEVVMGSQADHADPSPRGTTTDDLAGAPVRDAKVEGASGEHAEAAMSAALRSDVELGDGSRVSDGKPHNRTGVMRRRVTEARIRALYNATDLPHKRSYTSLLLQLPITDIEPVPEAEMYCLRRQSTTQVLSCNPRYRDYSVQYAFWQVTRKCHRRLWITTPYYLPTKKLFRALLHAASRGVDVRILSGSSQTTDPWFMWHASNYITARLLQSGVKIYEYRGKQILHAKTVVADSVWSSIGSYNWDVMSNKNLEVCLCQLDLDLAREMEKQFLQDMAMSVEVTLEEHQQRSRFLRFTSWLFYNFVFILDRITFRSFANQDLEDSPGTHRR